MASTVTKPLRWHGSVINCQISRLQRIYMWDWKPELKKTLSSYDWALPLKLAILPDRCTALLTDCSTTTAKLQEAAAVFIAHESAVARGLLAAGRHRLPDCQRKAAVQSHPSGPELHRKLRRHLSFPGFSNKHLTLPHHGPTSWVFLSHSSGVMGNGWMCSLMIGSPPAATSWFLPNPLERTSSGVPFWKKPMQSKEALWIGLNYVDTRHNSRM